MRTVQGIYKITNKLNGHSYVGQSKNIYRRFITHKSSSKQDSKDSNYPLYRAFRKYGIDNFEFEILEKIKNEDDLLDRETYWYDKLNPEYNQKIPEQQYANGQNIPVYQISMKTLKPIKEFISIAEASRITNTNKSSLQMCLIGKYRQANGYFWCKVDDFDNWIPLTKQKRTNSKQVLKIDKISKIVLKEYDSATKASEDSSYTTGYICGICRGLYDTKKSYTWVYKIGTGGTM